MEKCQNVTAQEHNPTGAVRHVDQVQNLIYQTVFGSGGSSAVLESEIEDGRVAGASKNMTTVMPWGNGGWRISNQNGQSGTITPWLNGYMIRQNG